MENKEKIENISGTSADQSADDTLSAPASAGNSEDISGRTRPSEEGNVPEQEESPEIALRKKLQAKPLLFPEEKDDKKKFTPQFFEIVDTIVFAMAAALLILTLIFRIGYVDGPSMVPNLNNGERYVFSGLFYTPKQGDIVIFQPDTKFTGDSKLWVKRVIAVGGQTIDIIDGYVYIDGEKLDERYLSKVNLGHTEKKSAPIEYPYTIPEGYVFLMGDNRILSKDCRDIGIVDSRRILGRLLIRVYPFNKFGTVD